jgi:prepilin-type processing-associated H-X9-DG protein
LQRTRSYSIECWLNCTITNHSIVALPWTYPWCKQKLSEVITPSDVFALIDEHEQSIDGGVFSISQPPDVGPYDNSTDAWLSLPADRHDQGCNLSFLDGHSYHWRWNTPKIWRGFWQPVRGGDLEDVRRLQRAVPHNETPKTAIP